VLQKKTIKINNFKNPIMIKNITIIILILCSSTILAQQREFYQLKVYSFETESQQKATDIFLETAYLPALKRVNISNVGVFKPRDVDSSGIKKTYILIPFSTLAQFESLDSSLSKDKIYLKDGSSYLKASHDKPLYTRIASTLLKAFEDHPNLAPTKLKGPREDRVYELRSYESATENLYRNKVDMFNSGGEVKLFDKLNFNAVFYGEVLSGAAMPNLMYMTTFENHEHRDAHWKQFGDSPEWSVLKIKPEYQNNVSHIDITFLYPTLYSDY
tara:strand:+ start:45340 stop:46155 length:816 start_codon:yes stop_codon:yes gene_type:complete